MLDTTGERLIRALEVAAMFNGGFTKRQLTGWTSIEWNGLTVKQTSTDKEITEALQRLRNRGKIWYDRSQKLWKTTRKGGE